MIKNVANDVVPMIGIFPLLIYKRHLDLTSHKFLIQHDELGENEGFHRGEYGYDGLPQNKAWEKNLPYDKQDSSSGSAVSLQAGHLESGVSDIKLFSSVPDNQDKQAGVFLIFVTFHPSLILAERLEPT